MDIEIQNRKCRYEARNNGYEALPLHVTSGDRMWQKKWPKILAKLNSKDNLTAKEIHG